MTVRVHLIAVQRSPFGCAAHAQDPSKLTSASPLSRSEAATLSKCQTHSETASHPARRWRCLGPFGAASAHSRQGENQVRPKLSEFAAQPDRTEDSDLPYMSIRKEHHPKIYTRDGMDKSSSTWSDIFCSTGDRPAKSRVGRCKSRRVAPIAALPLRRPRDRIGLGVVASG